MTTNNNQPTISRRDNIWIGTSTGIWLFLFLYLTAPFQLQRLAPNALLLATMSMGLITGLCYFTTIFIQRQSFRRFTFLKANSETLFLATFLLLGLFANFAIYKSDLVNGSYDLLKFIIRNFSPTVLIFLPVVLVLRKYFAKDRIDITSPEKLCIFGENKLDLLHLDKTDLVSISSAQNYVEISYLINNDLHKKLIRSSLKKIHTSLPFLKRVHRSHLINSYHLVGFKDKKTLLMTMNEIPFSEKYKSQLDLDKTSSLKS